MGWGDNFGWAGGEGWSKEKVVDIQAGKVGGAKSCRTF